MNKCPKNKCYIYAERCPGWLFQGWHLYAAPLVDGKPVEGNHRDHEWLKNDFVLARLWKALGLPDRQYFGHSEHTSAHDEFLAAFANGAVLEYDGHDFSPIDPASQNDCWKLLKIVRERQLEAWRSTCEVCQDEESKPNFDLRSQLSAAQARVRELEAENSSLKTHCPFCGITIGSATSHYPQCPITAEIKKLQAAIDELDEHTHQSDSLCEEYCENIESLQVLGLKHSQLEAEARGLRQMRPGMCICRTYDGKWAAEAMPFVHQTNVRETLIEALAESSAEGADRKESTT